MKELLMIAIGSALVNNVVLSQFLGICPFLGVSKKVETAAGMGAAVIFVITCLVQFVEMFLKKTMQSLYQALGVYLPLITTNCAVLGVALTNATKEYSILTSTVNGFAVATGFTISIILLAGIREKLEYNDISPALKGSPIVLVTAGLMAIAFCGFSGII